LPLLALLPRHAGGGGLCHRRPVLSGAAGFNRIERLGSRQRAHLRRPRRTSLAGGLELAFKAGGHTGCWWRVWRCSASTIYFTYLTH